MIPEGRQRESGGQATPQLERDVVMSAEDCLRTEEARPRQRALEEGEEQGRAGAPAWCLGRSAREDLGRFRDEAGFSAW